MSLEFILGLYREKQPEVTEVKVSTYRQKKREEEATQSVERAVNQWLYQSER